METSPSDPLSGIRILAVEQFGAGPFATMQLADLGADVIKIEDPGTGGDVARYVPPLEAGGASLYFESFNRSKRSIALDLHSPAGRSVFERLVEGAAAVFNNLRGDLPERMGLTYAALGPTNPAIVCCSLSGYGRTGDDARRPGYDPLVQAEAGWASLTGEPDGPPVKSGLSLADYSAGCMAAIGMLAAILDAQRTGRGRDVDVSLYDTALSMLVYQATWFLSAGIHTERQPMSGHPSIMPFQFFRTADGYIAIACAKEKFFRALAEALEIPELADDEHFSSFDARREHRRDLSDILDSAFRTRATADWMKRLSGSVPAAPVRSMDEALNVEELRSRGMLASYEHDSLGTVQSVGQPIKMDGIVPEYTPAPALAAGCKDILREAGYADDEMRVLAADGAFGDTRL